MFGLKLCYGCGKIIWWWEDAVDTETVGYVHWHCVIAANMKKVSEKAEEVFFHGLYKQSAKVLGIKGEKE